MKYIVDKMGKGASTKGSQNERGVESQDSIVVNSNFPKGGNLYYPCCT